MAKSKPVRPESLTRRLTEMPIEVVAAVRRSADEGGSAGADILLPQAMRSSSSTSFAALPVTGGNRLRSRSLIQRKTTDSALGPSETRLTPLQQTTHAPEDSSEDSSDGPETPADDERQASLAQWHLGEKARGKVKEAFNAASDVVFSITVPTGPLPTPALEAGARQLEGRLHAASISATCLSLPPLTRSSSFLTPIQPSSAPASEQAATLVRPIAILVALFVGSTLVAIALIASIPTLAIPHSLSEALQQTVALRDYSETSIGASLHILAVLAALFVYKQAFSIPGSVLLNVIFGALYGVGSATISTCVLTAVGSLACYFMAQHCSSVVRWAMPKTVDALENRLPQRDHLASFLLLARLFPLLPYSALNVAAGVLSVPVRPFFWTLVLGSFPYNFVTTQCGEILAHTVGTTDVIGALWTPEVFVKLVAVSLVSSVPVFFKDRLQRITQHLVSKAAPTLPLPATSPPMMHRRRLASVNEPANHVSLSSAIDEKAIART